MIRYVDTYRARFGVEPICRVLGLTEGGFLTSRGYRAAKERLPSDRAVRDEALVQVVRQIHGRNYSVYGVRKMHAALQRAGWLVGRDQTARLMRLAGVRGVQRGKRVFTTVTDGSGARPSDLVQRHFVADRPGRLWVADITYVRTWSGFAYTAFVTDVFHRKIVGWATASTLDTRVLPLQALNMALMMQQPEAGLVHHSDRGSQYTSIVYSNRLADEGVDASVGSRGDSYDNALAESVNASYKAELIRTRVSWHTVEQVEFATLEWVHWYNTARLHEGLGYRTPAEVEAQYYASHNRAFAHTTR